MHGPLGGREAEAELGERPLGVDEDHGALGVADVVGEVARHDRALAASLAADQGVSVLAVHGREGHRAALVAEQHASPYRARSSVARLRA